jgi:hypothetical protein
MLIFPVDKSKVQLFMQDLNQALAARNEIKMKKYNIKRIEKMDNCDNTPSLISSIKDSID